MAILLLLVRLSLQDSLVILHVDRAQNGWGYFFTCIDLCYNHELVFLNLVWGQEVPLKDENILLFVEDQKVLLIKNHDFIDPDISQAWRGAFDELDFSLCALLLFDVENDHPFHNISNNNLIFHCLYRLNKGSTYFAVMLDEVEVVAMFQVQGVEMNPIVDTQG